MSKLLASTLFSFVLFLIFFFFAWEATTFSRLAQFFPYYISVTGALLSFIYTFMQVKMIFKNRQFKDEVKKLQFKRPLLYIGWLIGYVFLIYVVGILIATVIFLAGFLYVESKFGVLKTMISISVVIVGLIVFSNVMNLHWPKNLLGI